MKQTSYPIDIVITWVDSNDSKWLKEKNAYSNTDLNDNKHIAALNRYKDQGTLNYLFRGIEKYMPWVRKVFFVTYGHLPAFLHINCEKLVIVRHDDFIPKEYLPTFNSNAILLNLHRIKDLSEHFIYFNDDMYVVNPCKKELFFKNGLPRDMAILESVIACDNDPFWDMMINNTLVINKHFSKRKIIKHKPLNWFSLKYSFKNNFKNFLYLPFNKFPGFYDAHIPNNHLKSIFEEVWEKEPLICRNTCLNKFRNSEDITEWTMRYWQLASNRFIPINRDKIGKYASLKDSSAFKLMKNRKKYKLICLNDETDDRRLFDFFDSFLNEKSSFEL